jgi:hypothetical protein
MVGAHKNTSFAGAAKVLYSVHGAIMLAFIRVELEPDPLAVSEAGGTDETYCPAFAVLYPDILALKGGEAQR